jgi:hypothetical protein
MDAKKPDSAMETAKAVMKGMLDSPPVPHEQLSGHRKPKRAPRKRAR